MRLPGNGLAALVFLLGCQRPDFQDLASGGVGQEMSGPVVRTVYAEERSDRREWVFDTVRGRFIPSTNDNESWRDGPLIMPRDNPDGSVTGILRLYPLTLVRLSAAELGEFISAQSDVVPQRLLGACPVYSVNDAPELVPGQASPGQGRDETADSTLPYWDPGGADPIDERWRRFKQVSLVNVRFDLLPTDRVSFEIRGSSNRPDVQLSVAAKIVKYLEDPSAPVAFSSTAEPKTLASTASQSFLDFDPEYISATRGGSYAVLLRLAELALFTGDGRVSPFPDVVANRLLIPLFLWENHIKLRPYEAEIRAARAAYAHRLAEV
ncbi:MAG: hypothetical protein H6714_06710 [Myxococcales bacterium]|nr:hypothetical protein [Myxococcales bacterium]